MQPFRSGGPAPCTQCGAPRADMLSANGEPVCQGCVATGEANARLAKGRRSGRIGALVGLVFGAGLIVASLGCARTMFSSPSGEADMRGRISAILLSAGILIVATCRRNLKRLAE